MKTAILLVSFGTCDPEVEAKSLFCIEREMAERYDTVWVAQAYTSDMIIRRLATQQIIKYTVEEALIQARNHQIECIYVVPTHMIPGSEYHKICNLVEQYKTAFPVIRLASPVLAEEADCHKLVPLMAEMLHFSPQYEYILMGHGTKEDANIRYAQMNQAFWDAGLHYVRIASVEAEPKIEDAMLALRGQKHGKKIVLHPFMVVAGEHAKKDMAGEKDSFVTRLSDAGYRVEVIMKGLSEYPQFRQQYLDKLKALMQSG
ncbi:MAG: sirohydrochlorin cobaltochelatase [Lachnospiraceae bacterium]